MNDGKAGVLKSQTQRNLVSFQKALITRDEHRDLSDGGVGQNARVIHLPRWQNPSVLHKGHEVLPVALLNVGQNDRREAPQYKMIESDAGPFPLFSRPVDGQVREFRRDSRRIVKRELPSLERRLET